MRVIVHMDADCFFAAVEQASDPKLRGKPVAVGGEKRGIIASASYEARQFGIRTPMPTAQARRLCPKLIVLPGDFERYEQFSQWMFSYCYDFTPDVEQTSIDEGYYELTATRKPAVEVARTIQRAVRQKLKITISEGIGSNKLVSAIASKLKKPASFDEVPAGREAEFLAPLPNHWLPGVGPKLSARLKAAGLSEIRQIAATPVDLLELVLGNQAMSLNRFARGLDDRPVIPLSEPAKSFSQQETFPQDLTDEDRLEAVLRRMADDLFAKIRADGRSIRTLTVKVRYNDMAEDQVSESLVEPTDLETDIYSRLRLMLRRAWKRRVSLRLVSLKLSNLYDGRFGHELPLTRQAQKRDAHEKLARVVDALRHLKGRSVIQRGHDLLLDRPPTPAAPYPAPTSESQQLVLRETLATPNPSGGVNLVVSLQNRLKPGLRTASDGSLQGSESRLQGVGSQDENCWSQRSADVFARHATARLPFVPLRVRSYYSFLDSTLSPEDIVELAVRHECPAIAMMDFGNLHGAVRFVQAAQTAGIKPLIGAELRCDKSPLLLIVESAPGYRQLCRLLSRSRSHSGHVPHAANQDLSVAELEQQPIRREELEGGTEGLIAISNDGSLAPLFPGRFYRLATRHARGGTGPQAACPPVHFATPQDRRKFDILQSIRTLTLLDQEHPGKRPGKRWFFRSSAELAAGCRDHPEWITHTREIADRCGFDFPFGKPQFPAYRSPEGCPARDALRTRVYDGLRRRYQGRMPRDDRGIAVPLDQVCAQVETELTIIAEVGYEDLFLITWDLLQDCRAQGIEWITRGSAADSLVCYCLGISDVCPIRYGLYFRRFLNKERMALHKLPDIDVDFPHDRKDDVVRLLFAKYGPDHCAVVGGFSTFQARSAVGDVAKVLGVSEQQIRRFTEHFPWSFGAGLAPEGPQQSKGDQLLELLRASPECRDLLLDEEPFKTAVEMAAFLDGFPRHPKMHPCGVVLSRQPIHELTPTFVSNKGWATTHFDMEAVEAVGLVKMDILAQGGLAVMRDTKEKVEGGRKKEEAAIRSQAPETPDTPGGSVGICSPPTTFDDPSVWEMITSGNARAVHHIESPAMTSLSRMAQINEIDGLIALVSVIRPGAANEQKKLKFTRRYQGMEPPEFPHPSLEPCLRSTFGLVVYEEHILQICEAFAGISPGRGDVLRRALVKQKWKTIDEIAKEFETAARAQGHEPAKIQEVWELVTGFNGYAFCKAHSTAYGVEAYQAAWLKRYHPAEFLSSVLSHGKGFYAPIVYVLECHRLGIPLLPPTINAPGPGYEVEVDVAQQEPPPGGAETGGAKPALRQRIRVPLTSAKGLTEHTCKRLLSERRRARFDSLSDFYRRVTPLCEDMELMIRLGAFDEIEKSRTAQYWEFQQLHRTFGQSVSGQGWLLPPPGLDSLPAVGLSEPDRYQRLLWEAEAYGFPSSTHPLGLHPDIAWETYCPVSQLGEHIGHEVVACGLVVQQRVHHQITGEPMKFLSLADWTGIVETELFAATYKTYGLATVRYPVLEITAKVEPFENGKGFSLRALRAGKPRCR